MSCRNSEAKIHAKLSSPKFTHIEEYRIPYPKSGEGT